MTNKIDFDEIRNRYPLEREIVSKVGELNAQRKVNCPFHADNSASMHVYEDGRWHCYGACNRGGDVVDFLALWYTGREATGATLFTVLEMLGEVGVTPLSDGAREKRYQEKRERQQLEAAAALSAREEFFLYAQRSHGRLTDEHRAIFRSWAISDEWIERARLGWDGKRLTIPASFRGVTFGIKRRRLPALDALAGPDDAKYVFLPSPSLGIYNADILLTQPAHLIVCEDEKSALAVCSAGGVAIATNGAAGFWRSRNAQWWSRWLGSIPELYFWRDADEVGVPKWEAGREYRVGDKVIAPNRGERYFLKCAEAGRASGTFPTGLLRANILMEEGTVKWRVCSNPGLGCALDFRARFPRVEIVDSAPYKDASDALADGIEWQEVVTR